jgi:hypothetical protein
MNEILEVANELSQKDFIVFAGSGVPSATGIPMWQKLIEKLLECKPINNIDLNTLGSYEFPDIVQKSFDKFDDKNDYYKIIRSNLIPRNAPYSGEEMEIVKTTNWILTTNFDETLESAFSSKFEIENVSKNVETYSLPDFEYRNLFSDESIIYLHGRANENFLIFKKDDYKKYYPSVSQEKQSSTELEDYLKYLYRDYTIVFIGFSFDDYYFKNSLKNIYENIKLNDEIHLEKPGYSPKLKNVRHYAFLKKVSSKNKQFSRELDRELESIKIKVVRYSEHKEWIECFETIRKLKKSLRLVGI